MRKFLKVTLSLAAMMVLFTLMFGAPEAKAQGGKPCDPCPTWWVDYNYIFPPCTTPVKVDVQWLNGQTSSVVETTDGHKIYNTPQPFSPAIGVKINGINIPIDGTPVWLPYDCDGVMPGMCLRAEVRCNPCLEIKLHLEPCQ